MTAYSPPPTPAGVAITGTGLAVPSRVVTNHDLEKMVDTSDDWIVQRTGIRQRHVADDSQDTSDLGAEATRIALENAGLKPSDLDLVICATLTPDMAIPASACQIATKIGASPCGAFDLNVACTGFVAGLNTAFNFIKSGHYKHIAVVGAEKLSKVLNWQDRTTCILFGDGAGAAIVSATDDPNQGCLYQTMQSDASAWSELYIPSVEAQIPESAAFNGKAGTLQMHGQGVFKFAVGALQEMISDVLETCSLTPDDIKYIIPHQSNIRIITMARKKLGFSADKVYINLERYGNTSAASVGICLHEMHQKNLLQKGDTVLYLGVGGGLSWASSLWRL
ncbi:MAG: beta-ketoacyl-ACP synthase III [Planctomycetota bacterium]|jgi:3-oxoacyl-[acyl-carrier-protein] synthase-3